MKYYFILLILLGVACSKKDEQVEVNPNIIIIKGMANVRRLNDGATKRELKMTAKKRAKVNFKNYFAQNCIKPVKMPLGVFNFFSNGRIEYHLELQRSLLVTQKCSQAPTTSI